MTMPPRIALALILVCSLHAMSASRVSGQAAREADEESLAPDSETERARVHFRNGVDFYHEANFRAALIEFKRAYSASPHYKLLYNLGQASLELREDGQAIAYFTSYLRQGGDALSAERRHEVEREIQKLQARLAHATITTDDEGGVEIYVDGGLVGKTPLPEPLKLSVGRRRISAVKAGFLRVERTFDVASGDQLTLDFEMKRRSQESSAPQLAKSASSPLSPAAWTGIATGVLGAGAISLSILTGLAQTDFDKERQGQTTAAKLKEMRDDAKLKALGADIAWGATIAAAGVTGVLLFLSAGTEHDSTVDKPHVKIDLGAGNLHVRGRF